MASDHYEACSGCAYEPYIKYIQKPHTYSSKGYTCTNCDELIPDYIPKSQQYKYLKEKYEV